jgi:hypothetical protein
VVLGQPQAIHHLGIGGNELGGEGGLGGVGEKQARGLGDGGVVAAGEVLGRVGERRGERATKRMGKVVVGVPGEQEGEVGRLVWVS